MLYRIYRPTLLSGKINKRHVCIEILYNVYFFFIRLSVHASCSSMLSFTHTYMFSQCLPGSVCACVFSEKQTVTQKGKEGRTLCVVLITSPREPSLWNHFKINTKMMFLNCGRLGTELKQYQ